MLESICFARQRPHFRRGQANVPTIVRRHEARKQRVQQQHATNSALVHRRVASRRRLEQQSTTSTLVCRRMASQQRIRQHAAARPRRAHIICRVGASSRPDWCHTFLDFRALFVAAGWFADRRSFHGMARSPHHRALVGKRDTASHRQFSSREASGHLLAQGY